MFRPLRLSGLQQLQAQQLERRGLHASLVAAAGGDSDGGPDPSGRDGRGDDRRPAAGRGSFGRGRGGPRPPAEPSSGLTMGRQSTGPVHGGFGRGRTAGQVDGSRIRPQGPRTDHSGGQSASGHPRDAGSPHHSAQTFQGGTPRAPDRETYSVGPDAGPRGRGARVHVAQEGTAPLTDALREVRQQGAFGAEPLGTREMDPGPSRTAPGHGASKSPSAGAGRGRGAATSRPGLPGMRTAQGVMQRPRQVWQDRPSPDQPRTHPPRPVERWTDQPGTDQRRPSAGMAARQSPEPTPTSGARRGGRRGPAEIVSAAAAPDADGQGRRASTAQSTDSGGFEMWDPSMFDSMFDEVPAIVTRPRLNRAPPKTIEDWEEQQQKKRGLRTIDDEEKGPIFGRSKVFRTPGESGSPAPKPRQLDTKKATQFERQIEDAEKRAKHYWDLLKAGESSKMKFYPLLDEIEALLPELPKTHWMKTYLKSSIRAIGENNKISNRDRGKFAMSMVRTLAAINDSLQSERESKP